MSERIIIGEGERAGLPISAEIVTPDSLIATAAFTHVRWVRKGTGSQPSYFVLEWFDVITKEWKEVPCLVPEENKTV